MIILLVDKTADKEVGHGLAEHKLVFMETDTQLDQKMDVQPAPKVDIQAELDYLVLVANDLIHQDKLVCLLSCGWRPLDQFFRLDVYKK